LQKFHLKLTTNATILVQTEFSMPTMCRNHHWPSSVFGSWSITSFIHFGLTWLQQSNRMHFKWSTSLQFYAHNFYSKAFHTEK